MTPSVVAERVPPRAHTRLKEARSWRLSGKDLPSQPGRATGRADQIRDLLETSAHRLEHRVILGVWR